MTRIALAVIFALALMVPAAFSQEHELVWVQIEARPTLARAQDRARSYDAQLADVNGFALGNGWYALALGPYEPDDARYLLRRFRNEGVIPPDSFIARSADYGQQFWPVGANIATRQITPDTVAVSETEGQIAPEESAPQNEAVAGVSPEYQPVPVVPATDETLGEARANERLLSREERAGLQIALKWAGVYNGQIDASFGRGTRLAMAEWQAVNNFEQTGILTTLQRKELLRQYNAVLDGLGLHYIRDEATGIEMKIPSAVVALGRYDPPFAHFTATGDIDAQVLLISQPGGADSLAGLYDIMQTLEIVPEDGPRNLEKDQFILIGESALSISHTQAWLENGQIKGFTLIWPAGDEERRMRLLSEMQASFVPIDGVLDPATDSGEGEHIDLVSGLEIRKPRLSRSGFFVDAAGRIATTSDVVTDCRRITIDHDEQAEILINDSESGIAILRPKTSLAPIAVARFRQGLPRLKSTIAVAGYSYGGLLNAPTLTFGELADLRGLGGETAIKRLMLEALDGDAGGPVIDSGGAVLGMLLPEDADGRILPEGVSFATTTETLQRVLALAGISDTQTEDGATAPLAPELLSRRASEITVLVSCWD